jgi:hypothetical protein
LEEDEEDDTPEHKEEELGFGALPLVARIKNKSWTQRHGE